MVSVNINLSGWDVDDPLVGMTYRGDIVASKLPVKPESGAVWGGEFYDVEDDVVKPLSASAGAAGTPGPAGKDGATITKIELTQDPSSKAITAGKATLSNGQTVNITIS